MKLLNRSNGAFKQFHIPLIMNEYICKFFDTVIQLLIFTQTHRSPLTTVPRIFFLFFFFSFRSLVMKRIKQRINRCLQKNTINDRLFSRITSLPLFCSHFPLSYDSINERTVYICNQWILLYEVYITCIH